MPVLLVVADRDRIACSSESAVAERDTSDPDRTGPLTILRRRALAAGTVEEMIAWTSRCS